MTATSVPRGIRLGRTSPRWPARQWATTPGRLRLLGVLLIVAATVFGVVAASATHSRRQAASAVANDTEPLLVEADGLYASLSDADATAAATFLTGGLEPASRRQRYLADLRSASAGLTTLSRQVGDSGPARVAVSTLGAQLPVYTGLVDTARANNRQGLPVGAAYLREASKLMSTELLPAARDLYAVEARRLGDDYRAGTSSGKLVATVVVVAILLAALLLAQLYLARVTHRILNLALLAATLVVVGLGAWMLTGYIREQDALVSAQRDGSDSVQVFSAVRILALRAQTDQSLALVARGGGDVNLRDFDIAMRVLSPHGGTTGLLSEANQLAMRTRDEGRVQRFASTLDAYRTEQTHIAELESSGEFAQAVKLSIGTHSREAGLATQLNAEAQSAIGAAQSRFESSAKRAHDALGGLGVAIPVLAVVTLGLALLGLRPRLGEYR